MSCWHKYPKQWTDSQAVYKFSRITADQYKRCTKCNKVKIRKV